MAMQKKNKHGLIVLVVVLLIVGGTIFITKKITAKSSMTKAQMADFIVRSPASGFDLKKYSYQSMINIVLAKADDLVSAWYHALSSGQATFSYNGQTMSSKTGDPA